MEFKGKRKQEEKQRQTMATQKQIRMNNRSPDYAHSALERKNKLGKEMLCLPSCAILNIRL